jgi:hypothetical protein
MRPCLACEAGLMVCTVQSVQEGLIIRTPVLWNRLKTSNTKLNIFVSQVGEYHFAISTNDTSISQFIFIHVPQPHEEHIKCN